MAKETRNHNVGKTQYELRSKEDFETEREWIDQHTKLGGQIEVHESGRPMWVVYENPVFAFYRSEPDVRYARNDMTEAINKVITDGPEHPKAEENVRRILEDGDIYK